MTLVKEFTIEQPDLPETCINVFAFSTQKVAEEFIKSVKAVCKYQIIKGSSETQT